MKPFVRKIGFALVAVLLGLAGLEIAAHAVESVLPTPVLRPLPAPGAASCMPLCMPGVAAMPDQPKGLPRGIPMSPNGRRAWALPANTTMVETNVEVRVNAQGLRGGTLAPRSADEWRLLTLGDSSVFGFGVEEPDVFGAVAASRMAAARGRPVTDVNGGTPGYTSVQALATLQDVGAMAQPTHVVIATLWSDLFQTDVPVERAGGQRHPLASYRLAVRWLAPWLPAATVGWTQGDVGAEAPGRSARVGLDRFRQTLEELVVESRRLGAEPVVMILPAPVDLDNEPTPLLIAAYRKELHALADRHGLVRVDGPAVFSQKNATNADFYDQVHPSTSGHFLLGEALSAALLADN